MGFNSHDSHNKFQEQRENTMFVKKRGRDIAASEEKLQPAKQKRKRMTQDETYQLFQECVGLYLQGYAPTLIAYILEVRPAVVDRLLVEYFTDPDSRKVACTTFLAKPQTKLQDIYNNIEYAPAYTAEFFDDGRIIFTPFIRENNFHNS